MALMGGPAGGELLRRLVSWLSWWCSGATGVTCTLDLRLPTKTSTETPMLRTAQRGASGSILSSLGGLLPWRLMVGYGAPGLPGVWGRLARRRVSRGAGGTPVAALGIPGPSCRAG